MLDDMYDEREPDDMDLPRGCIYWLIGLFTLMLVVVLLGTAKWSARI